MVTLFVFHFCLYWYKYMSTKRMIKQEYLNKWGSSKNKQIAVKPVSVLSIHVTFWWGPSCSRSDTYSRKMDIGQLWSKWLCQQHKKKTSQSKSKHCIRIDQGLTRYSRKMDIGQLWSKWLCQQHKKKTSQSKSKHCILKLWRDSIMGSQKL